MTSLRLGTGVELAIAGLFVGVLGPACDGAVDAGRGARDGSAPVDEDGRPIDDDRELVDVSHPREFRGVWVASVGNINFPSSQGLTAEQQQAELRGFVDTAVASGLNALVFHVRPEGDALYRSDLEPWSRFLSGTQGGDPGYDPLEYLIEQAHPKGIEVHAWFNPYRAKSSSGSAAVAPHMSVVFPEYAYTYGSLVWMDPGAKPVEDRTFDVIEDVVERYDVDGIHFDDYFYPYPQEGVAFPDGATYAAYTGGGGTLSLADWRRDNVNRLVSRVATMVKAKKPHVRFGISPFGIYRPGMPPGITGLDQYASLYADPVKWVSEGWLDYIAPQLYWPTTQTAQAYGALLDWWSALAGGGTTHYTFIGNAIYRVGESAAWTADELRAQVLLTRAKATAGALGNIFFQIGQFEANHAGLRDSLKQLFYETPVLTPPVLAAADEEVPAPYAEVEATTVTLTHPKPADLRAWLLYEHRLPDDAFVLVSIVPATGADELTLDLGPGDFAASVAAWSNVESQGVRFGIFRALRGASTGYECSFAGPLHGLRGFPYIVVNNNSNSLTRIREQSAQKVHT